MPVVSNSTYVPPFGITNGHLQTMLPLLRKVNGVRYLRERIETPDEDFLDLDWAQHGFNRIAILSHGLEGNSSRNYVLGMVKALRLRRWDAVAWNYRSCGGVQNKKLRWYHSGDTADLQTVIQHVAGRKTYSEIALIGFSLGGNITLKYLGELEANVPSLISRAVALSVPCDLESSAVRLARPANMLYMKRFLITMRQKVRDKKQSFPGLIDDAGLNLIKTFTEFDNRYTAPFHGFINAHDYFERCSSRRFLAGIRIPALLINAQNDPFLEQRSFPYEEAEKSAHFFFEAPSSGGHMGFISFRNGGEYWSESRTLSFLDDGAARK